MRKWSHGHSIGVGVLGGILLTSHSWLLVAGGLVVGWFARELYSAAKWTAHAVAERVERPRAKPTSKAAKSYDWTDRPGWNG
jgi:hypothetical protein